jgi:predicted Rossmann fold flavoprotein
VKRIAIIGGGASGLMAACFAAGEGNSVVVFEKQKKIGRKILVSGNGRCNITNCNISDARYHGRDPRFVNGVFSRYGLEETVGFFRSIGLPLVEEENGKLFPASLQSTTVVRIMEYELARRGVEVRTHRKIESIKKSGNGFRLVTAGRENHEFDSVILSAGSCAFSPAGGSRDGYELARMLDHTVREPFPAILPINIPLKIAHRLQGIKWDCSVKVVRGGSVLAASKGELLFTAYGISGPASLDVSRAVNESVLQNYTPLIVIDLFPSHSEKELADMLGMLWADGEKTVEFSLIGIMKNPMPDVLLRVAGIDPAKPVKDLTDDDKAKLVGTLKAFTLEPGRPRGFNEAVVAAGGVNVDEIDPQTMESRLTPKLYMTGELLDIDGDSGGYNLQFAWSTGAIAGMSQH